MTSAELNDGRLLHYVRQGVGEPLLLIQGMAGHHRIWGDAFVDQLARDFDVVAYDHRGVGESTDLAGGFSIVDLATDAVELMNALGWPAAHVVGISLGGMVAQELVLHEPRRVRGLVIGCSYAGGPGSSLDAPGPMEMFQAMQSGDINKAIRAAYTANLSSAFTADEAHFAPFFSASTAVRVPMTTVMRQAQAAAVHSTQSRLRQITSPTLVMHGTSDRMLRYSNGQLIASLIPGARLHTFDDVGHLFWWEQPELSATAIRDHLLA